MKAEAGAAYPAIFGGQPFHLSSMTGALALGHFIVLQTISPSNALIIGR